MRKLMTVALVGTSLALVACDTAEEAEPAAEDTTAMDTLPLPDETATPGPTDTATPEPADTTTEEPAEEGSDAY